MGHPHVGPLLAQVTRHLQHAANVAREHGLGSRGEDVAGLAGADVVGHVGLGNVVAAGRTAAHFTFGQGHQVQAGNEKLRVHRRFYKDMEAADRAVAPV